MRYSFIFGVLLTLVAFVGIGKQNIFTTFPRGISNFNSPIEAEAVLYPSHKIDHLIKCMTPLETVPTDNALADCAKFLGLNMYVLVPNLFQHIGFVSSGPWKPDGWWHFYQSASFYDAYDERNF